MHGAYYFEDRDSRPYGGSHLDFDLDELRDNPYELMAAEGEQCIVLAPSKLHEVAQQTPEIAFAHNRSDEFERRLRKLGVWLVGQPAPIMRK